MLTLDDSDFSPRKFLVKTKKKGLSDSKSRTTPCLCTSYNY